MSSEEKPGAGLPVHAKGNPNVEAEGTPTKSALKKAAKEAEKAAKKAAAKEKEAAQRAAQQAAADEDKAVDNYGSISKAKETEIIKLKTLTEDYADKIITFYARVENTRAQSAKLGFLTFREQGHTIQAVLAAAGDDVSKQMVKWAMQNPANSILRVTGLVKKVETPIASATIQTLEINVTRIYEVSRAQDSLPMSVKDAEKPIPESGIVDPDDKSPPVPLHIRLDNRVIDLQADINQAIFTISSAVEVLFTNYMFKTGARKFNTPKLVGAATEGGAGVFAVTNYFGKTAYLAQSPQFYKQMLIAADCESVFEIGPVFRAENSNTHRHLTEFTGLDFEMVFNNHYHEVLTFAENLIVHILITLQKDYTSEIATIQRIYPRAGDFRIKDNKALRLTYAEGVRLLKEAGVDTSEQDRFETDLSTAMEKQLGKIIRQKYDTDFYVLDEFPMAVRPFYTKAHPTDKNLSNSYDFFMRGEEIMSGAQRINDSGELEQSMRAKGVDPSAEGFKDYVDAFRQGCRPHAGGGLGLNRIVQFFLGLDNVRQATPFPRDPQRLRP